MLNLTMLVMYMHKFVTCTFSESSYGVVWHIKCTQISSILEDVATPNYTIVIVEIRSKAHWENHNIINYRFKNCFWNENEIIKEQPTSKLSQCAFHFTLNKGKCSLVPRPHPLHTKGRGSGDIQWFFFLHQDHVKITCAVGVGDPRSDIALLQPASSLESYCWLKCTDAVPGMCIADAAKKKESSVSMYWVC